MSSLRQGLQGLGDGGEAPPARVEALVESGVGRLPAPAGRVFKGWVAVPEPDRTLWGAAARGVAFVAPKG